MIAPATADKLTFLDFKCTNCGEMVTVYNKEPFAFGICFACKSSYEMGAFPHDEGKIEITVLRRRPF